MREKLMLSKSAYPVDAQRVLTEMEKFYKKAVRDSRFEAAAGLSEEQDEVIRTLNILALIGKNTVQNTETEKLYFAYLTEQDEEKKAALKEKYVAALRGYGTEEKERDSRLAFWIGESDSKTCNECQSLKGTTYKPEDVPDLPHPNCRCEIRYVAWGAEKRKEEAAAAATGTTATTANTAKKSAANTAENTAIKAIASAAAATAAANTAEKATGKAIASATTATATATIAEKAAIKAIASATTAAPPSTATTTTVGKAIQSASATAFTPATTNKRLAPVTSAVTVVEHLAPKTVNTHIFGKGKVDAVDAVSSAAQGMMRTVTQNTLVLDGFTRAIEITDDVALRKALEMALHFAEENVSTSSSQIAPIRTQVSILHHKNDFYPAQLNSWVSLISFIPAVGTFFGALWFAATSDPNEIYYSPLDAADIALGGLGAMDEKIIPAAGIISVSTSLIKNNLINKGKNFKGYTIITIRTWGVQRMEYRISFDPDGNFEKIKAIEWDPQGYSSIIGVPDFSMKTEEQ